MPFQDRTAAGRSLAAALQHLHRRHGHEVVVLALPRGGVPVAYEVARALEAPLDVIVVRKLGVPRQPELAMGAIGEGGVRVLHQEVLRRSGVSAAQLAAVEQRERAEVQRRAQLFRGGRARQPIAGRTAVVVDDGIATGSTARAACQIARASGAARVVLAVPVAPVEAVEALRPDVDELVCLEAHERFYAVGQWYADFAQLTDDEVVRLLAAAAEWPWQQTAPEPAPPERDVGDGGSPASPRAHSGDVQLRLGPATLPGILEIPEGASGAVLFAHGSGSGRHSPRNRAVAATLVRSGLATLLFDLLTPDEARQRANVFDIDLLSGRLVGATRWLVEQPAASGLPVGYFGASTGAAAALVAAAELGEMVGAVVSRGGRPDLAGSALGRVRAPTLLIVGGADTQVLALNRQAQAQLAGPARLEVVPGATHLFEEPGALEAVARLAVQWFTDHLRHR